MTTRMEQLEVQVARLQTHNAYLEAELKKSHNLYDRARAGHLNLDLQNQYEILKNLMKVQSDTHRMQLANETSFLRTKNDGLMDENAYLRAELRKAQKSGTSKKKTSGLFGKQMIDPAAGEEMITVSFTVKDFKGFRGKLHQDKWQHLNDKDLLGHLKELGQTLNKANEDYKNGKSTN